MLPAVQFGANMSGRKANQPQPSMERRYANMNSLATGFA
jgi:hypothetical protein